MTEPDKERAERVGDPKLDAAYRALGAEEPPRALDEAVLAASRRALKVHPAPLVAPTGRRPWFVPLAAAAVLALAVGVTLHMQMEQPGVDGPPPAAPSVSAPGAAADLARMEKKAPPASAPPAVARQVPEKPAQDAVAASPAREKAGEPEAAAAVGGVANLEMQRRAREESAHRDAERSVAPAREPTAEMRSSAPETAPAPAMAMAKRADAPTKHAADTPERDLERIAELRKQGRHDEADKALVEFRKRHPEFKIPPAMLERVERR